MKVIIYDVKVPIYEIKMPIYEIKVPIYECERLSMRQYFISPFICKNLWWFPLTTNTTFTPERKKQ